MSTSAATDSRSVRHRKDIQGLRAVAVLAVMGYHAEVPGFSGGFVGVDVFLVVSGFVIGGLLLRELVETDTIDLRAFFSRRARRLLPAAALMLSVVAIPAGLWLNPAASLQTANATGLAASLFGANFYLASNSDYFSGDGRLNPFLHTWSLSVEEQFFALLPFLMLAAWVATRSFALQRRVRVLVVLTTTATIASFAVAVLATFRIWLFTVLGPPYTFYLTPLRAWQFGLGILLAIAGLAGLRMRSLSRPVRWTGLATIGLSVLLISSTTDFPGFVAIFPTVGAGLVVLAGMVPSEEDEGTILAHPRMVAIGDWSYSLYLWHWPPLVLAHVLSEGMAGPGTRLLAVTLGAIPAALSYRYLEQPLRRNEGIRGRRALLLAAVCVVVPAAIHGSSLFVARTTGLGVGAPAGVEADMAALCERTFINQSKVCVIRFEGDRPLVLLLGDSHAQSMLHGVSAAAGVLDLDLMMFAEGGCAYNPAFIAAVEEEGSGHERHRRLCPAYAREAVALVDALQPDAVIIAHRGNRPFSGPAGDRGALVPRWFDGLGAELGRLQSRDVATILLLPLPEFPVGEPTYLSVMRPKLDTSALEADERARYADVIEGTRRLARELSRTVIVDPFAPFCENGVCSPIVDGDHGFSDGHHLSRRGALTLTDLFAAALAQALGTSGP